MLSSNKIISLNDLPGATRGKHKSDSTLKSHKIGPGYDKKNLILSFNPWRPSSGEQAIPFIPKD